MPRHALKLSALLLSALLVCSCCKHRSDDEAAEAGGAGFKVVKQFPVGGPGRWDYLLFDHEGHRLFVTRSDRVIVLDPSDGHSLGVIPNTKGVHGVALAPDLNRGFASNGQANTVTIFNYKTLETIGTVEAGKNPDCIIYDPASKRVFAFNGKSQDLSAFAADIDPNAQDKRSRVSTLALGGKPEFAVADGSGHIYVNIEDTGEVLCIDSKELKITARWKIAPAEDPSGLAMDIKHRRLFVGCGNETMVVLNADTGSVVATLPIGKGVDAVTFDPKLGLAFSSNGEGTLTVVREESPEKFSVAETVKTTVSARTMALDAQAHRVYLAAASFGPTPAGAGAHARPPMVEDSFVILVVAR